MNITDHLPALGQVQVFWLPFPSSSLCEIGTAISLYLWRNGNAGVNSPTQEQVEIQTQLFFACKLYATSKLHKSTGFYFWRRQKWEKKENENRTKQKERHGSFKGNLEFQLNQ